MGRIVGRDESRGDCRFEVQSESLDMTDVCLGDSIAVNGCCLTVVEIAASGFSADVSRETLRCTTLGNLQPGAAVNLEKAMQVGGRFGGHIVSGHVDGVGELLSMDPEGGSVKLRFRAPASLARYIAAKGSICIDGTSLTVNEVEADKFTVNIIPHTRTATIIAAYKPGQAVNLEVDVVARYLERLLNHDAAGDTEDRGLTKAFLEQHGFGTS